MGSRRGFPLIDLLIVVVIIGLVATVPIANFSNMKENAYVAGLKPDIRKRNGRQPPASHTHNPQPDQRESASTTPRVPSGRERASRPRTARPDATNS